MKKELLDNYKNLMSKIAALRAEAEKAAKTILHESTASYLEKYSDTVEQIFWNQYTPWFNDGESCEFSVGELGLVLVDDDTEEKYDEGSVLSLDTESYEQALSKWAEFNNDPTAYMDKLEAVNPSYFLNRWYTRDTYSPHYESEQDIRNHIAKANAYPADFITDTNSLFAFINSIEPDIMEQLFGNHVTVRITANGVETVEYSHD